MTAISVSDPVACAVSPTLPDIEYPHAADNDDVELADAVGAFAPGHRVVGKTIISVADDGRRTRESR
jgi:hypothetical protein